MFFIRQYKPAEDLSRDDNLPFDEDKMIEKIKMNLQKYINQWPDNATLKTYHRDIKDFLRLKYREDQRITPCFSQPCHSIRIKFLLNHLINPKWSFQKKCEVYHLYNKFFLPLLDDDQYEKYMKSDKESDEESDFKSDLGFWKWIGDNLCKESPPNQD